MYILQNSHHNLETFNVVLCSITDKQTDLCTNAPFLFKNCEWLTERKGRGLSTFSDAISFLIYQGINVSVFV